MEKTKASFTYPDSREKADLAVYFPKTVVVFEIKCFVRGADSNKKDKLPQQVERLRNLVVSRHAEQGIFFLTYFGYSDKHVNDIHQSSFGAGWIFSPLTWLLTDAPLRSIFASYSQP